MTEGETGRRLRGEVVGDGEVVTQRLGWEGGRKGRDCACGREFTVCYEGAHGMNTVFPLIEHILSVY